MKTGRRIFFLALRALPLALPAIAADAPAADAPAAAKAAPKQSVPNPLAPRFKQIREHIDSLFEHRIEAPPPLDPRANPFRTPGAIAPAASVANNPTPTPGSAEGTPTSPAAAPTNLAILQQAVATLKVSGVFEISGKSHLVINARPYKEGDVVQTLVQGETIYLRVREISKRSVTLVLNDAEMTLRF